MDILEKGNIRPKDGKIREQEGKNGEKHTKNKKSSFIFWKGPPFWEKDLEKVLNHNDNYLQLFGKRQAQNFEISHE